MSLERITIKSGLSLGDHIVMLMAIESLHIQFPKQYITATDIPQKDLYNNHPAISKSKVGDVIEMHYPLVHKSNQISNNFADGYCDYLGGQLGIPLKLQVNHAHLYLSEQEKNKYKGQKYWVIVCGGKNDFTAKHLSQGILQEVVDHFIGRINFVQPVKMEHTHYPLQNVKMLSKLGIRDLLSLIYNCEGVICPVTAHQHIAGVFSKPCICIGGGREPVSWVQPYPAQHYIHSLGTLSCCKEKACWKSRVIKLEDGDKQDNSLCEKPVFYKDQWIPTCLARIKAKEITSVIERIV